MAKAKDNQIVFYATAENLKWWRKLSPGKKSEEINRLLALGRAREAKTKNLEERVAALEASARVYGPMKTGIVQGGPSPSEYLRREPG